MPSKGHRPGSRKVLKSKLTSQLGFHTVPQEATSNKAGRYNSLLVNKGFSITSDFSAGKCKFIHIKTASWHKLLLTVTYLDLFLLPLPSSHPTVG